MTALRAIAEAATSGPWRAIVSGAADDAEALVFADVAGTHGPTLVAQPRRWRMKPDAAHIAAWSPDRALAALDVIEAAQERRRRTDAMKDPLPVDAFWEAWAEKDAAEAGLTAALDRWEALP